MTSLAEAWNAGEPLGDVATRFDLAGPHSVTAMKSILARRYPAITFTARRRPAATETGMTPSA